MSDVISRQVAISAICSACGKIDCDKMDKCEKLQLPPANCSEFPNRSDTISRQAAIDVLDEIEAEVADGYGYQYAKWREYFCDLPSAQPNHEPLTDKEQRIFLAAIERERKVCKEVDDELVHEPYEVMLSKVCDEIERKVKGALWT